MKKHLKLLAVIIPVILVLTGCKNIFIEYKRPDNQLGSKWISSDKSIELVIKSDYDHNSFCTMKFDTGETRKFFLAFDYGFGMYLYDESVFYTPAFNDDTRYEHWNCSFINRRKFVATVEKTTFFELGQEITFYRVDEK